MERPRNGHLHSGSDDSGTALKPGQRRSRSLPDRPEQPAQAWYLQEDRPAGSPTCPPRRQNIVPTASIAEAGRLLAMRTKPRVTLQLGLSMSSNELLLG